jgi:hypothetical protein
MKTCVWTFVDMRPLWAFARTGSRGRSVAAAVEGWRAHAVTAGLAVRVAAVLVLGLTVGSCSVATAPTNPPATGTPALKPFNVVVLGDSIAGGVGATGDSTRW